MLEPISVLLQKIRERPALYLGKKSLDSLVCFMYGYEFRESIEAWENWTERNFFENFDEAIRTTLPGSSRHHFMNGFDKFVHSYYQCELTTMRGETLISMNSVSQEDAFDKYFELYDKFLKQKGSDAVE